MPEVKDIQTAAPAQETAEILGKNPSTIRGWLFQGRKRLKKLLEVDTDE